MRGRSGRPALNGTEDHLSTLVSLLNADFKYPLASRVADRKEGTSSDSDAPISKATRRVSTIFNHQLQVLEDTYCTLISDGR